MTNNLIDEKTRYTTNSAWRVNSAMKTEVNTDSGIAIAECHMSMMIDQAEKEANARLIAAAPEMLKELKAIGHHVQVDTGHFNRIQHLIERIEGK